MEDSPLLAESVRRPRFSLSSSMRLTVPLLGLLLISRWAPSGAVSLLQHHSQVALLEEELTDEAQSVELLRFITPYKTEVEAIVDVTGYAQLLKDVLAAEKELRFYVGIDTWVGNDTRYQVLYFNNVTGRCQAVWSSQGNAWNVSLDLIAWPRTSSVPIQPRDTILLAESFPNPLLQIGQFQVFEASLRSSELALPEPRSLFDAHEISSAVVYPCEGVEQFQRGASLGFLAQQAEDMVLRRPMVNAEVLRNISVDLEKLFLSTMVSSKMITAKILNPGNEPGSYLDVSLSSAGNLSEGLPVFFASGAVVTDARYTAYLWMNMSMAFEPIGFVKKVLNATHFRMNVTLAQCFHHLNSSSLPQLQVPKDDRVLPEALSRLRTAAGQGIDSGLALRKEQKTPKQELRVLNAAGTEVSPIATVRAQSGSNSSDASRSGQKVCVVKQNRQGHVFTRSFTATLSQGERGVLHFTATGHGWAATSEQCGEYCHAVYHLRLNGKEVANVTQWRDDCYLNPTGPAQHGTWYESRNGWCPGSVEPGIYLDVSEFLASGENVLELGLTVWLNATHRYDKYTDVAGFIQQDVAMLAVSSNLLLYAAPAVSAALAAPRASSKAQLALRQGCSDPKALRPPAKVQDLGNDWLTSPEARKEQKEEKIPRILPGQVPFDFEARAPWYFYNHSEEILPGVPVGASYLNILNGTLVQSNSRTVYGMLHELKPAQQLALRLRLLKPAHLEMDHWDRVASVGLMVPKALDHVQIQTAPSREPAPSKYWRV